MQDKLVEADAEAAARSAGQAQENYLSGNWAETMPAHIRERLQQRSAEACAQEEAKVVGDRAEK